jgi:hypothetical protein
LVIDGKEHFTDHYNRLVNPYIKNIDEIVLPTNVGANGFYGHRVFAAFSYLVNEDYVCFLDEDNWLEPDHVEAMVENLQHNNLDWTHSLRNIYRKDGDFACRDDCESLGQWPAWNGVNNFHADASAFLVKRDVLVRIAGAWYGGYAQDRIFFQTLKQYFPNWKTTCNYSLNYRLGGNEGSVKEEFFVAGNKYMEENYKGLFPWKS